MTHRTTAKRVAWLASALSFGLVCQTYAAETVVDQRDLNFVPSSVAIAAGDTVRFTDTDHITHNITVTSPDGTSEDKGMDRYHEDIIVQFAKSGVYQVHCRIHPAMKMTITVR